MIKKVIQDNQKDPPIPQRYTSECSKVILTQISNASKCENRVMTSILRGFKVEETLNQDFAVEANLSSRQSSNVILKSMKR